MSSKSLSSLLLWARSARRTSVVAREPLVANAIRRDSQRQDETSASARRELLRRVYSRARLRRRSFHENRVLSYMLPGSGERQL